MTSKSKSKPRKKTGRSARKPADDSKSDDESDYPNIIEGPIRVVGDRTGKKSKAAKSGKEK